MAAAAGAIVYSSRWVWVTCGGVRGRGLSGATEPWHQHEEQDAGEEAGDRQWRGQPLAE